MDRFAAKLIKLVSKIAPRSGVKLSIAVVSASVLAGCSISGFGPDVDPSATASIVNYEAEIPLGETVDPSDWDTVRSVMSLQAVDHPANEPIQWQNEKTGTAGTIIPLEHVAREDGQVCRQFSTTLNGIGGVKQYRGHACRDATGAVELVEMKPHEAVVQINNDGQAL